jgi:SAM-dependent methyltransferase
MHADMVGALGADARLAAILADDRAPESGPTVDVAERAAAARRAVEANPHWYHSIELAPGVVTPGHVDLRDIASRLLPGDLSGKRALDVGTFDGFWAFEMERRGAEVVAIDVDAIDSAEWPPLNRPALEQRAREWKVELGLGFRLAAEALGSSVQRVVSDVYDLTPERIDGPVDFAFSGAILLHLRDPVRALERIHDALAPGGTLTLLEPFSALATLRAPRRPMAEFQPLSKEFNWWYPNLATLLAWPLAAGFVDVRRRTLHRPRSTAEMSAWYAGLTARRAS